ncbi:MAG: hypothetical protein WC547_08955 [Candidatus Omnitrophota bacterium]
MIELLVRFKEMSHFYISSGVTAACIFWVYYRQRKGAAGLWPVIILNFTLFIAWGVLSGLNHDDVPFKDFWEHHSPFLPVLTAPFLKSAPHSPLIFDIARIFSGCVFVLNILLGWRIARQVWQAKARLSVYLLMVSGACIFAQYLFLRPDIFMISFVLAGISVCLDIPRKGAVYCLLSGVAFGLAMSFITKQYLLIFLPVIAVFLGVKSGRAARLVAYAAGLCAGILPLAAYLFSAGIIGDFLSWAVGFNGRALHISVNFPLIFIAAATAGAVVLMRRFRLSGDVKAAILFYALVLGTFSSLTSISDQSGFLYYLGLWYFICAIAVSGAGLPELLAQAPSRWKRSLIAGIVLGALLSPNFVYVWKYRHGDYFRDKQAVASLMEYTRDSTCVVILPVHPVFAVDATRLYSNWQLYFMGKFPSVRLDAVQDGLAQRIISIRPAVVMCRFGKKDFILELYQRKIITSSEYKELIAFLTANYRQKQIGDNVYYLKTL